MPASISVEQFNAERDKLIKLREKNPGKRGYGEDATARKIGALLGFTGNKDGAYGWRLFVHFSCPVDRSWIRQSFVSIYTSPSGLCTAHVDITSHGYLNASENSDDKYHVHSCRFCFPSGGLNVNNYAQDIFTVPVFESPYEALQTMCIKAGTWITAEMSFFEDIVNGKTEYKEIASNLAQKVLSNLQELFKWIWLNDESTSLVHITEDELRHCTAGDFMAKYKAYKDTLIGICPITPSVPDSSLAVTQPAEVVPADNDDNVIDAELYKPGDQTRLAGEEIMPTRESVDGDDALAKARKVHDTLMQKLFELQREVKKIKNDALAPYKEEIDEKNSRVELMTFVSDYWGMATLMEEARVKSEHEAPVFCVYAYVLCGKKDVYTAVGTRQNVCEKAGEVGPEFVYTIAEFRGGRDVSDEE